MDIFFTVVGILILLLVFYKILKEIKVNRLVNHSDLVNCHTFFFFGSSDTCNSNGKKLYWKDCSKLVQTLIDEVE